MYRNHCFKKIANPAGNFTLSPWQDLEGYMLCLKTPVTTSSVHYAELEIKPKSVVKLSDPCPLHLMIENDNSTVKGAPESYR